MTNNNNSKETLTREEIRNALIKLGIKSHDDVFGIVPNMDQDKVRALGTVITSYIQFLLKDKEYMNDIVTDCPNDDSITTDEHLNRIHSAINLFQDRDYTQKILSWDLSDNGEIRYGSYNLFDLTNRFIEDFLVGKGISGQFAFLSNPLEGFFDENLTTEDKNLIAGMKKDRIAFYGYHNAGKGVHLATVRWVSMSEAKNLYFGYETENNGILSMSNLQPLDCIQEDKNIQAGLKKYGFVKDLPKDGEKYTDEEVMKIFEAVNAALERTNNQVYVLKKSDSLGEMQFIPDLESCSEILDMPTPNGIRVNEFLSAKERDDVARKLADFMAYAQEHGESTVFAGTQYPSDQNGITFEDRRSLECFKTYGNEVKNANKAKATVEAYKAKVNECFFSLTNIDIAKEALAHMAKYRPGSYTLFEIANICGCYCCTSDKGGLWGCVHSCRFVHDFTPEYEAGKASASN